MLTSGARPNDAVQLRDMGIEQHLMKPIKQSELFSAMVSALDTLSPSSVGENDISNQISAQKSSRSLKILLAEDNAVNQKLAVGILGSLGHQVSIANNGREAIEALANERFDLVLMDVQMPEMDGLTATREIRDHEKESGHHIPIVAMTAHAMKGDREECLAAGMDDYLTKPIRLQDMTTKLDELFPHGEVSSPDVTTENATSMVSQTSVVIDWERAIQHVGGDRQLFCEVVQAFLDDTPKMLEALEVAENQRDLKEFGVAAHSIKGSMLFINPEEAVNLAQKMETLADGDDMALVQEAFGEFKQCFATIRRVLEQFVRDERVDP